MADERRRGPKPPPRGVTGSTASATRLRPGRGPRRFRTSSERITCLAFSPDGKLLASLAQDNTVCLWNPDEGVELHRWSGPKNYVRSSVVFSPDSRTLAIATKTEEVVRLYDTATG